MARASGATAVRIPWRQQHVGSVAAAKFRPDSANGRGALSFYLWQETATICSPKLVRTSRRKSVIAKVPGIGENVVVRRPDKGLECLSSILAGAPRQGTAVHRSTE